MFVLCPHCQFLVTIDPASGRPPTQCPRCGKALVKAAPVAAPARDTVTTAPPAEIAPPAADATARPARKTVAERNAAAQPAGSTPAAAEHGDDAQIAPEVGASDQPAPSPPVAKNIDARADGEPTRRSARTTIAANAADSRAPTASPPPAKAPATKAAPAKPVEDTAPQPAAAQASPAPGVVARSHRRKPAAAQAEPSSGTKGEKAASPEPVLAAPAEADTAPATESARTQDDHRAADAAHATGASPADDAAAARVPETPGDMSPAVAQAPARDAVTADDDTAAPAVARRRAPSFVHAPRPVSHRRRWPSLAAIAGLALLLGLQLLLADRAALAADARWRPTVATLCNALRCTLPPWHEPAAFTLLARDVRPARAGVLHVSASFRNDARWPQAWPLLHLALQDVDGRTVGARTLVPAEYLGRAPITQNGIATGQSADVAFDIAEPGATVVAFTFDFR